MQVVVHQFGDNGMKEVLAVQFSQGSTDVDDLGTEDPRADQTSVVQDAYAVFTTPPPGGKQFVQQVRPIAHETARPSKRHKRDPNRPRGYISAFNFFVQDKRPAYVQNHPEAQVTPPREAFERVRAF